MTTTADTSGTAVEATGAATSIEAAAPAAPPIDFTKGQVVRHTWHDPYHAEEQSLYGIVVELPTEGDASVPEDEQTSNYGVAWLARGTAALPGDELEAV